MLNKDRVMTAVIVIIGAAILIGLLFVPPFIGIADNGDYPRIMSSGGISVLNDTFTYEDKYFGYAHSQYEYAPFGIGYASSQVLFVFIAGLLGRLWDSNLFTMHAMGVVYSVLMLLTLGFMIYVLGKGRLWLQMTLGVLMLFIFFDIGYVAYFQSLFGEPVSLIFLLLSASLAIALATQEKPSSLLAVLLFVCAWILAMSKIQNAPVGLAFAAYGFRLYRRRSDVQWKRILVAGSSIMVLSTVLMYVFAPGELKQINLYQTIFFGILKDSPHVKEDLQSLGIPEKYEVLAGTNYFQTDVAIKQDAPELTEDVYSKLGHFDVVRYYATHPARIIDKLEAAAANATFIRPYYLGNYVKEEGKSRGEVTYTYSTWSEGKKRLVPESLLFFVAFYVLYIGVIVWEWIRKRYSRGVLEVLLLVAGIGILAVAIPLVGDGEADIGKHLFLFNVVFDMMVAVSVVWVVASIRNVWHRIR